MNAKTHLAIDSALCGQPEALRPDYCRLRMLTSEQMAADEKGLVHGGFVFGMADYAAMLAVNHPNVVLGAATSRFLKPVRVGDTLVAEAQIESMEGQKQIVGASVSCGNDVVFEGQFTCFTLERHVLEG